MKLMLVDDEEMTREGLLSSIPWEDLGINEIIEAKDGLAGLELARRESPQIVLCDIRMPRMDGLSMVSGIMEFNPNIVAIILTGFAEVDYLKQAITLNVVNFIEKPVNLDSLKEAIRQAVRQAAKYQMQQQSAQIHSSVAASRLAYQLTFPYDSSEAVIRDLYKDFLSHYGSDKFQYVTSFVVRPEELPDNSLMLYSIGQQLHDHLLPGHFHVIYTDRRHQEIVYYIYGQIRPVASTLRIIGERILSYYKTYTRAYIAIGSTQEGIRNAWHSFENAMSLMQYARFYEPDTILDEPEPSDLTEYLPGSPDRPFDNPGQASPMAADLDTVLPSEFKMALDEQNLEKALGILDKFRAIWYRSRCMDSQIKTIYYSLFNEVIACYHSLHIVADYATDTPGVIIDLLDSSFSFTEVDKVLCERTEALFEQIRHNRSEDPVIYRIRDYISGHYQEPGLSVKTISENVYLSVSYLCTYFKNETGITLNQFITDFRMKKAISLLTDTNMKIVDVSNAVGYRDSNYFAKLFKKQTGYTPKEYKRRIQG